MKCSRCPKEAVSKRNGKSTGFCKECKKENAKAHYLKDKEKYLERAKRQREERKKRIWELKSKPCEDCKVQFPPWVMEFDHLDGSLKIEEISTMNRNGRSWKKIEEEISKCEVVCANCHKERTYRRSTAVA